MSATDAEAGPSQPPNEHVADSFGYSATLAIAVSSLGFLASFLGSIAIARILGPSGKGTFSLFMSSITGLTVFGGLGIGHGQMFHASRNPRRLQHFLTNGFLFSFLLGLVVFCSYLVFGPQITTRFDNISTSQLLFGLLLVPVLAMITYQAQFLLTIHEYVLSRLSVAIQASIPVFAVSILVLSALKISVANLIVAVTVGNVLLLAAYQYWIRNVVPEIARVKLGNVSWEFARQASSFGIRQYLSDATYFLINRLDFFLIAWLLDHVALGIYTVAVALGEVVTRLSRELGILLFPVFASASLREGQASRLLRKMVLISAGLALCLGVIAEPLIILLFGEEFREAIPIFRLLLPGMIAWSTIHVTWNRVSAGGHPGLAVPVFASAAVVDAIFLVVLVPLLALSGAAIAASVAYTAAAVVFLILFCRREGVSVSEAIIARPSDIRSFARVLQRK